MSAPATALDLPPDLPTLPAPDSLLLTRLIALDLDLPALAKLSGRPLPDLLHWAVSEPIRSYVSIFEFFRRQSAQAKTYTYYESATNALVKALDSTTDPIEIRRIAEAILRAAARLLPPAPRSKPAKTRQHPGPADPEPSPPASTPAPAAHAEQSRRPTPRRHPPPTTTHDSGPRTRDVGPQDSGLKTTTAPRTKPALLPTHIPGLDYPAVPPLDLPIGPILPISPARRTPASLAAAAGAPGPGP